MIIISTEVTSLGLKLSQSFKVSSLLLSFLPLFFLENVQPEPKGQEVNRVTAEGSHLPRATDSSGERVKLLRGRVKSLMLQHAFLLRHLDV